jgi:outer membrane protein assembly factor BamB
MIAGRRWVTLLGVALAAMTAAACGDGGATSQPVSTAPGIARTLGGTVPSGTTTSGSARSGATTGFPAADWPTYNRDLSRDGVAIGVAPPGTLSVAWRAQLDGAVYGQPLLIGNYVVAATENDSVYALDRATGRVAWHANLGTPVPRSSLPCGDIDPLGITSTPAYDQATGIVYTVAETTGYRHTLFGLSITNGAVKVERYIPTPDGHQENDQQRPALAIADGRVYVAFGGLYGDCGQYQGSVVGVPLSGSGPLTNFVVPTTREGAVWGTAGPVFGPDGNLYVAAGNSAQGNPGQPFDGGDSVTQLTPGLQRVGYFAPATWADDNANDRDLGSTQPALAAGGAILQVGKRGIGYLLQAGSLGGVGSEIAQAPVCTAYGAAAVAGSVVYVPCRFDGGVTAVQVSVANKEIKVLWRGPSDADGSPVVGGGVVWVTASDSGSLYALSPTTGTVLGQLPLGDHLPHFSSMSLSGSNAYLGTLSGIVAVSGA